MAWVTIPDSDIDPDSPLTTGLMTALRDNLPAMAARESGAPTILGASLDLLDTKTASASAQVDFTSSIDSTYDRYIITICDLVVATDATSLRARFSQASTFKTDSTYSSAVSKLIAAGTESYTGAASTTSLLIGSSLESASTASYDAVMYFTSPDNITFRKKLWGQCSYQHSASGVTYTGLGGYYIGSVAAIDGIRFFMSSGNITSGTFRLYGIKDA